MRTKIVYLFLKPYALITFIALFFINSLFLQGLFIGSKSLVFYILLLWLPISILLFLSSNIRKKKNLYYILGSSYFYFIIILSIFLSEHSADSLVAFYSLSFFSIVFLLLNENESSKSIKRTASLIDVLGFFFILYSFMISFSFINSPFLNVDIIGETRFTFDNTYGIIVFLLIWYTNRLLKTSSFIYFTLYVSLIFLGFLRVLSSGTRGIAFGVILAILYLIILNKNIKIIQKFYSKLIVIIGIIFISFAFLNDLNFVKQTMTYSAKYLTIAESRGASSGIARISEAKNDFETFLEHPLLGAGMKGASKKLNSLGEPSYGHFFLTGILGRFGLMGLLSFLIVYLLLFKQLYMATSDKSTIRGLNAYMLLIGIYMIFGNPLYLFPAWPGVAFLLIVHVKLYGKGKNE